MQRPRYGHFPAVGATEDCPLKRGEGRPPEIFPSATSPARVQTQLELITAAAGMIRSHFRRDAAVVPVELHAVFNQRVDRGRARLRVAVVPHVVPAEVVRPMRQIPARSPTGRVSTGEPVAGGKLHIMMWIIS
eukprot:gene12473-biopygen2207